MNYRPEIDGLRALAVLPVILFHAGFSFFSGGYIGVDVFFVISGYLITSLIIHEIDNNQFSIVNFYERRARRILPALFTVSIICIPFAWAYMLPNQMKDFSQSILSISIFSSNILFWLQSGYFAPDSDNIPLLHTWSLAVEEQFYVFFPIFLLLFWKFGKNKVFLIIFFLSVISLMLSEWGWRNYPSANFYLLTARVWELFAGSICALILRDSKIKGNDVLSIVGLSLIVSSIFLFDQNTPFPSIYSLIPVSGVVILILFANDNTIIAKLFRLKYIVGIGLISYSIYLFHHPLFAFARLITSSEPSLIMMIFLSLLSIFLGAVSWKYIEQPFRDKSRISIKFFIYTLSAIFIFFFIFGILGHKTNGYQELLLSKKELNLIKTSERSSEDNCYKKVSECLDEARSNSVLLLGDSNAYHFSSSLKQVSDFYKMDYIQMTMGGCLPMAQFTRLEQNPGFNNKCITFNSNIIKNMKSKNEKIGTIVVSAAWLLYYHGQNYYKSESKLKSLKPLNDVILSIDGKNKIEDHVFYEEFYNYLDSLLKNLNNRSKKLIIVGPIPPALINFEDKKSFLSPTSSSKKVFEQYSNQFNQIIEELMNYYNFEYINLKEELCDDLECRVVYLDNYLYGNATHMSNFGQNKIMKPLLYDYLNEK